MPRDERLKKRIGGPRINDSYLSGYNRKNAGRPAGTPSISASSKRAEYRKRRKGSSSAIWNPFKSLRLASRNQRKNHIIVSTSIKITLLICLVIFSFIFFENDENPSNANTRKQLRKSRRLIPNFKISFSRKFTRSSKSWFEIDALKNITKDDDDVENDDGFGKLEIQEFGKTRQISDLDFLSTSDYRLPDTSRDDDGNDAYLAFDDDFLRGTEGTMNKNPSKKICHRTSSHRNNFQNCNAIYELELLDNHVKYLNAGAYRQVFSLQHHLLQKDESIVVKDMYCGNDFAAGDYEFVRMDAMVAERLTSSPRIYDIYGYCGLSILSEFFPHGDIEDKAVPGSGRMTEEEQERQKIDGPRSYNNFTSEQKLVISLQMAEALADLHGDKLGVIVHQDVQLSQFLMSADKTILKLNDFNRAEFMLWDEKENGYCKYGEGRGHGTWRSPEEYYDKDLDQQVDVYSLGNNMYSVLTGLWIFYDEKDDGKVQKKVEAGVKPFIDPRFKEKSIADAKLAEIIDKCHSHNPEDRPSIFEVVDFLRDALEEARGSK